MDPTLHEKGLAAISVEPVPHNGDIRDGKSSHIAGEEANAPVLRTPSSLQKLNGWIEGLSGFEARGIARVPPEERQPASRSADLQVMLLWMSANLTLNNTAVGLFGPLVFGLGFLDSALLAVFGALVGAASTAYKSIWGPQSGNRTIVVCRYFFGYWPAKIPTFLNIVLMVGYCTIDCILGGQVLSAVSGGRMTIIVGIVIVALVSWVVAVFGMALFQRFERFAWLPQVIALFVLIGYAGPDFDVRAQPSLTGPSLAVSRASFFSLCLYLPNSWGAAASDFYVTFSFDFLIAIGLATGTAKNAAWASANDVSTVALLVASYEPLEGFGKFCSVIVALGVIANIIPGTYSAALGCQVLGRYGKAVPRWVWSSLLILVESVLALAGCEHPFAIFSNFLALMGCIGAQEHLVFRRHTGFDWSCWEDRSYLPIGWAALSSFPLGWVGAILGMSQVWYVGPLATLASLADVGMWVGCAFTLVTFPVLRHIELRVVGR